MLCDGAILRSVGGDEEGEDRSIFSMLGEGESPQIFGNYKIPSQSGRFLDSLSRLLRSTLAILRHIILVVSCCPEIKFP